VIINLENVELADLASAEAAVSAATIAELAYGLDTDDLIERHARDRALLRRVGPVRGSPGR
jgi:hypothetical protein